MYRMYGSCVGRGLPRQESNKNPIVEPHYVRVDLQKQSGTYKPVLRQILKQITLGYMYSSFYV